MLLHSATARDLDQLTARVSESTGGAGARMNAYRIDGEFFIDIDLPGAGPADVDVTENSVALTIKACRRPGPAGTGSCQVPLAGALDTDRLEARFENGVLTLDIPRKVSGTATS